MGFLVALAWFGLIVGVVGFAFNIVSLASDCLEQQGVFDDTINFVQNLTASCYSSADSNVRKVIYDHLDLKCKVGFNITGLVLSVVGVVCSFFGVPWSP